MVARRSAIAIFHYLDEGTSTGPVLQVYAKHGDANAIRRDRDGLIVYYGEGGEWNDACQCLCLCVCVCVCVCIKWPSLVNTITFGHNKLGGNNRDIKSSSSSSSSSKQE